MENTTNANDSPQISPIAPASRRWYWFAIVALFVVGVGSSWLVYHWQHQKLQKASKQMTTTMQSATSSSASSASPMAPRYATNVAVGYPLSLPKKKVLMTLSVPSGNSILQTDLATHSQDELASNYTESDNDVVANWIFNNTGTPANPSDNLAPNQSVTVTALNDWMSKADGSGVSYVNASGASNGPMTVAQKTAFVNSLKGQSATCTADATKGFATADKVFNICVTLIHPQAEGGDWVMNLSGYAEVSGTRMYLRGSVDLPASSYQTVQAQYIQALKNTTTVVQANNS